MSNRKKKWVPKDQQISDLTALVRDAVVIVNLMVEATKVIKSDYSDLANAELTDFIDRAKKILGGRKI